METLPRKKRSDAISETGESKRCTKCGFTKKLEDFNKSKACKDGHRTVCRNCTKEQDKKRLLDPEQAQKGRDRALRHYYDNQEKAQNRNGNRQLLLKMKAVQVLGGKCEECGENHPACLQFHHINPEEKSFSLSTKTLAATIQFPWEVILEELKKCKLLCANCHAKHHSVWKEEDIKSIRELYAQI